MSSNSSVNPNSKILVSAEISSLTLTMNSFYDGAELEIKLLDQATQIELLGINKINDKPIESENIVLLKYNTFSSKLIYINSQIGWSSIPDNQLFVSGNLRLPIEGLQHKFFASDLDLRNNELMAQWDDTSGNLRHATQTNSFYQPQYKKNIFNDSYPAVYFGGNKYFNTDLSYLVNQKYLIAVVEGRETTSKSYLFGMDESGTNRALHVGWRNNTTFTLAQYANDLDASDLSGYTNFSPNIWILVNDNSGHAIWRNGVKLSSNTNTTNLSKGDNGRLGRALNNSFVGHLGLVAVYTASLPDISSLFTSINQYYQIY